MWRSRRDAGMEQRCGLNKVGHRLECNALEDRLSSDVLWLRRRGNRWRLQAKHEVVGSSPAEAAFQ